MSMTQSNDMCKPGKVQNEGWCQKYTRCLQHKVFQASVFTLLATMALCMISITALYLLTLKEEDYDASSGNSNNTMIPLHSTAWSSSVPPTSSPGSWPPDVDFCDLLYCDQVYCCPSPAGGNTESNITSTESAEESDIIDKRKEKLYHHLKNASDWTNTTMNYFMIKENQQIIDSRYCLRDECGPGRYTYRVPINQFVPVNMRITLLMNSTELLVVHLCRLDESVSCSTLLDKNTVSGSRYPSNTQGEHEWPLHVARLYHSSYHFRSTVAGQADCSTDHYYAGALFTDYHFHFYRHCTD